MTKVVFLLCSAILLQLVAGQGWPYRRVSDLRSSDDTVGELKAMVRTFAETMEEVLSEIAQKFRDFDAEERHSKIPSRQSDMAFRQVDAGDYAGRHLEIPTRYT